MNHPSAELRARVLEAVRREPSPARGTTRRRIALAVAAGFAPLVAIFCGLGGVDHGERPVGQIALTAAGGVLLSVAATWGTLTRGQSMLGRPLAWLIVVMLVTPVLLFGLYLLGTVIFPVVPTPCDGAHHAACLALGTLMGLGPLTAFAIARRATNPVHPALTGAALGAAAGAWGGFAIATHCAHVASEHMLLGHTLPVVVVALLGALVARWGVAIRGETK